MTDPQKGVAYTFPRGLFDSTTGGKFKVNPTIAAGDFKISKDFGAFANLANLPTVQPAGSTVVVFSLTATEMTADHITIQGIDQAGNEWTDFLEHLTPVTMTLADLPTVTEVADAVLLRDWTTLGTGIPAYCVLQALRHLRNAWQLVAGTPPVLHVKTEDGSTDAWVRNVTTDTAAQPITGVS